ncbi:MAG: copper amine oxidase [Clostridiales bacterium]|nr:copper amine oxidase [Clostridiales bacterium]
MKIKKRILAAATAVLIMIVSFVGMVTQAFSLNYRSIDIYIDGVRYTGDKAFLIEDTTYVPVRMLSQAIRNCSVYWDEPTRTATVSANDLNVQITAGFNYIIANGRYLYSPKPVRILENDRMYLPIRLLAAAFDTGVEWDGKTYSVHLTRGSGAILSGDQYYNENDLYWLSRIISAESRGEPLLGQIAVGNVVLNRVDNPLFPNSIYDVIFDNKYAVQFTPTANGTIYHTPSETSVIAAKICLEGYSLSDNIYYFFEPVSATSAWVSATRTFRFQIGNHRFYS